MTLPKLTMVTLGLNKLILLVVKELLLSSSHPTWDDDPDNYAVIV
jgi:hypothetical protein